MDRKEAYIYAMENEIKSANLYKVLANSFEDEELIKTFNSLASFESIHQDKIRDYFAKEFGEVPFTYNKSALPKIDIRHDLSDPKKILEYAIYREIAMADQYEFMADESKDEHIKTFFKTLVMEENDHKEMLEDELNRIQGLMIWFDPSELNGLMEY